MSRFSDVLLSKLSKLSTVVFKSLDIGIDDDRRVIVDTNRIVMYANKSKDDDTSNFLEVNMFDDGTAGSISVNDKDRNKISEVKITENGTIELLGDLQAEKILIASDLDDVKSYLLRNELNLYNNNNTRCVLNLWDEEDRFEIKTVDSDDNELGRVIIDEDGVFGIYGDLSTRYGRDANITSSANSFDLNMNGYGNLRLNKIDNEEKSSIINFRDDGTYTNYINFNPNGTISTYDGINLSTKDIDLSQDGYLKLSNGLIFQWGKETDVDFDSNEQTIDLNISFPNNCFNVTANVSMGKISGAIGLYVKSVDTDSFVIVGDHTDDTASGDMFWFAVGN